MRYDLLDLISTVKPVIAIGAMRIADFFGRVTSEIIRQGPCNIQILEFPQLLIRHFIFKIQ